MNRKKINLKIMIGIVVILMIAIVIVGILVISKNKLKPEETLKQYFSKVTDKDYEGMYELLNQASQNKIEKEEFIKRNQNIYEGIDSYDIKIEITNIEKEGKDRKISYQESMQTQAGKIEFSNTATMNLENKEYKLNWSSAIIFPQLRETDKIRISTIPGTRGEIVDRNGEGLAINGKISSIGIVPGKLGSTKEESIKTISELTGVSTEYINQQLKASYVKEDTFVPIKKVAMKETELKEKLLQIPGIMINSIEGRVYPLGEEAAHLIGYVQAISQEELKEKEGKGYNSNSIIGKAGLEQAYEERLKASNGAEIYIEDEKGNHLKTLAKQDKKDGETIKLTIDYHTQKQLYDQLKTDKGFFVVMEPNTGELLALVSTPSFDSNDFVTGMTNSKWEELNQNEAKPLYNRFLQTYSPGSTFKPITGAIGITTGKINAEEDLGYTGTSWKNNDSWGNYQVTTLTGYTGPKNLQNALIHSDNIYFAKTALKIGAEELMKNLDTIGFNEQIDFPLTIKKSTYSSKNKIEGEIKLADSGYGQGDILINPIHMASIYSAFANKGIIMKPYIEANNGKQEIAKKNVFTEESAEKIQNALIQVVDNPEGTAHDMKIAGETIAGKTGTAELKKTSDDQDSGTLGWFNCYTVNSPSGQEKLIISMVENKQDNRDGGSHYLIQKIRTLFIK